MAEQWDPPKGESRGPGGPGLNRNALQATLADLVREADGPAPGAGAAGAPAAGAPLPIVPGAPVPAPSAGPRPLRGPSASHPVVDADASGAPDDPQAGPRAAPRPAPSNRPKLPFSPEPAPSGSGPAGAVRPGSGVSGGFSSSVGGGGFGGGSLGASSLSGRITPGDLGDNLARLAPTPTEQPTIPLRKRRPAEAERDAGAAADGAAGRAAQAPAAPAQPTRPVVAIEAWSPHYDDILPQRPTRTGRAFRRAR